MRVFAPAAFRWTNGFDYPYGWQDLPQALADAMKAASKVVDEIADTAAEQTALGLGSVSGAGILGTFTDAAALQTAYPAGTQGRRAMVGSSAPYTEYVDNGSSWAAAGGGGGSTTFAGLSDKATADIPGTNTATAAALALKAPIASPTFTGTVSGITKAMVGLSNVDNTADTAKPVSTAQQTALNLKADLASPALTGAPTAPTAATNDSSTKVATTGFVAAAVANIGVAPLKSRARSITHGKLPTGGRWKTAFANVIGGTGSARILLEGDSTWTGAGSNATTNRWRPEGPGKLIPAAFNTAGYAAENFINFLGAGSNSAANTTNCSEWDSRLTVTGSVSNQGGASAGGLSPFLAIGASVTFTPGNNFDTVDLYTIAYSGGGSLTVTSPAGSHGSINTNGTRAPIKTTISIGSSVASVTLTCSGAASAWIGADCSVAASKKIRVLNGGWGGSKTSDWIGTSIPDGPPGLCAFINPDLIVCNLGINDWVSATSVATFAANLYTYATQRAAISDLVFVTGFPSNTAVVTADQSQYRDVIFGIAAAVGAPTVDLRQIYGPWLALNAAGATYDDYHPKLAGYRDLQAAYLVDSLVALANL